MNTEIYYFTGTGNSFSVAGDIAKKINGKLTSIPSVIDSGYIESSADTIGIVFPVYYQGVPDIVKRYVRKMKTFENKYVFGVCTYGDNPCLSLEYLDNMLKSRASGLSGGFSVNMPYNYITPSFAIKNFLKSFKLREVSFDKQQAMFREWEKKIDYVCSYLMNHQQGHIEVMSKTIERLVDILNLRETLQKKCWLKIGGFEGKTDMPFMECPKLMDNSFNYDHKCNGCGICTKICPVGNIEIENGRPIWLHRCQQCFACLQWCPKEAVQFGTKTSNCLRYHHPGVKLPDMIRQAERIEINKS